MGTSQSSTPGASTTQQSRNDALSWHGTRFLRRHKPSNTHCLFWLGPAATSPTTHHCPDRWRVDLQSTPVGFSPRLMTCSRSTRPKPRAAARRLAGFSIGPRACTAARSATSPSFFSGRRVVAALDDLRQVHTAAGSPNGREPASLCRRARPRRTASRANRRSPRRCAAASRRCQCSPT